MILLHLPVIIFMRYQQQASLQMKKISLYIMSALYILAGINHFIFTKPYVAIMPSWLPWHYALVYISGILESLFGYLLLLPFTRRLAAWLIIFLLIAVFPANIQMMINYYKAGNPYLWLTILRLPLQPALMYWAYLYAREDN